MLRCTPINKHTSIGVHMSTRDSQARGAGKSPPFHMRINPDLKEQFENEAQSSEVSLANWMKELGREALRKKGVEPKG